jgi:hypothetical protein
MANLSYLLISPSVNQKIVMEERAQAVEVRKLWSCPPMFQSKTTIVLRNKKTLRNQFTKGLVVARCPKVQSLNQRWGITEIKIRKFLEKSKEKQKLVEESQLRQFPIWILTLRHQAWKGTRNRIYKHSQQFKVQTTKCR